MTTDEFRIMIADELSADLALRDIATLFMQNLESFEIEEITIDFERVESITRTFAHEYLSRKARSHIKVREINVPDNIQRMFSVINYSENRPRFAELRDAPVIDI